MTQLAKPPPPPAPVSHHGVVAAAPAKLNDPFTVTVPGFDQDYVFQIRRWEARGSLLPAVGDEVLVVMDDVSEPWVAAWWPAKGDEEGATASLATAGIGMIIGPGPRDPGFAFAHAVYVSVEEPVDAGEYDQWIKPE